MTEAVQSLQALLGRISSFFDIFDLSFVVSGASSLAALFLMYKLNAPIGFPDWLGTVYGGILIVLGCYVLGMMSFILGRIVRRGIMRVYKWSRFDERLAQQVTDALREHDIKVKDDEHSTLAECVRKLHPQTEHSHRNKPLDAKLQPVALRLYTLLWTQVRQQHELAPSHVLLNRYWVMAALCDGMIVASILWFGVLVGSLPRLELLQVLFMAKLGVVLALLAFVLFVREAERYSVVQVNDLVSTLAWERGRPVVQPAPSSAPSPAASTVPAASPPPGQLTQ